jgi:hypothetical protein
MSEKKQRRRRASASAGAISVSVVVALLTAGLAVVSGADKPDALATREAPAVPVVKDWTVVAGAAMTSGGFAYPTPTLTDGVLSITGDAPDAQTRMKAFDTGIKAVLADKDHVGEVLAFDNAITIAG